jgi:pyruvate carboxylase
MKVGVPVVPGTPGPVDKWTDADSFIKEYGFPGIRSYYAHIVGSTKRFLSSYHQGCDGRWRPRHACRARRV